MQISTWYEMEDTIESRKRNLLSVASVVVLLGVVGLVRRGYFVGLVLVVPSSFFLPSPDDSFFLSLVVASGIICRLARDMKWKVSMRVSMRVEKGTYFQLV